MNYFVFANANVTHFGYRRRVDRPKQEI